MRSLNNEPAGSVTGCLRCSNDVEDNWDFEGMVTAVEVALSGLREMLREVQCFCKIGGESTPTTVVEVVALSSESVWAKRKDARISERITDM